MVQKIWNDLSTFSPCDLGKDAHLLCHSCLIVYCRLSFFPYLQGFWEPQILLKTQMHMKILRLTSILYASGWLLELYYYLFFATYRRGFDLFLVFKQKSNFKTIRIT